MARDLTPILKRARREGTPLHPKAIKGLSKRGYAPGEHGQSRMRSKPSQYSIQLREKQKVKRIYGLLEKQFRRVVEHAERSNGVTGDVLLQILERRLDNAVYRAGIAPSRQAARQLVTHGHFMLNGRRVDIPSIQVSPGDEITVRPKSAKNAYFSNLEAPKEQISWLSYDAKQHSLKITGLPQREDADQDISEQLIIEFYSR
jgi:small subunit ribosomal protein S4